MAIKPNRNPQEKMCASITVSLRPATSHTVWQCLAMSKFTNEIMNLVLGALGPMR
jgi:hypothetical protein